LGARSKKEEVLPNDWIGRLVGASAGDDYSA
jgi:hypothetical protein